ncbi:MAG: NADPH-dependent F420 reductase [Actinobacteria bacterium]|nr:NADPH-dependent F420 reductase [Actinomycetota bacterium]
MKIGIVGAGKIGHALSVRFTEAGHDVLLSNSRGPDTLEGLVQSIGVRAQAGTAEDAARWGDVVVIAVPLSAARSLPAEQFAGKVVVDANNYYPERDGNINELDSGEQTSSELVAAHLPGARVVKAFNTVYFERLLNEAHPERRSEERLGIPVAGDDAKAKAIALDLIDEIGFTGVDAGDLAAGRRQQPGTPVYNVPASPDEVRSRLDSE